MTGTVITDEFRGAIAYQLTKRLVIDMPTARACVDDALVGFVHSALTASASEPEPVAWQYRYIDTLGGKPTEWRNGKGEAFSILPGYEVRAGCQHCKGTGRNAAIEPFDADTACFSCGGTGAYTLKRYSKGAVPVPTPDGAVDSERLAELEAIVSEHNDELALIDWISDKIGLPHNEELSRENFSAWLSSSTPDGAVNVLAGCFEVGQPVTKTSGYPFPGDIRAAFTTRAGLIRYVVEATGSDYAGMLHIFSPTQLAALSAALSHPADGWREPFDNLSHIVQYRRADGSQRWTTMAAFDSERVAEKYRNDCSSTSTPWEYRVVPAAAASKEEREP